MEEGNVASVPLDREAQRCDRVAMRFGHLAQLDDLHARSDGVSGDAPPDLQSKIDEREIAPGGVAFGHHVAPLQQLLLDVAPLPEEGKARGCAAGGERALQHAVNLPLPARVRLRELAIERFELAAI